MLVYKIICGNALDTTLIDYTKATVIFLYLFPRGLRLINHIIWPDEKNLNEGEVDEGEVDEGEEYSGSGKGEQIITNEAITKK